MSNQIINRRILLGLSPVTTTPVSVLQTWYDSLSIKPSAGLWTDLKIMADGMDADGDWSEMDFMSMIACMETDEQRLRPLKTTSGDDMVKVGSPTFDSAGVVNPSPGSGNYINTKWNPVDNGVKYTLDSALFAVYGDTITSTGSGVEMSGSGDQLTSITSCLMNVTETTTSLSINTASRINGVTNVITSTKTGLSNAAKRYFCALIRTSSSSITKYVSGSSFVNPTNNSTVNNPYDFYLLGVNYENLFANSGTGHKARCLITGSSLVSPSRVQARLQTFFTARGLTITNF